MISLRVSLKRGKRLGKLFRMTSVCVSFTMRNCGSILCHESSTQTQLVKLNDASGSTRLECSQAQINATTGFRQDCYMALHTLPIALDCTMDN